MKNHDKYLTDFNVIKQAIGQSKNNNQWIRNLFLIMGIMSSFLFVAQLIANLFILDYSLISIVSPLLKLSLYFLSAVLLLRIAYKAKRHTNIFFRLFISLFILASVILPIVFFMIRSFSAFTAMDNNLLLLAIQQMNEFLNIFIFSISLIIAGSITENGTFTILSILNLFIYFILFTINDAITISQVQMVSIQFSNLYSGFIISIGYILLASILFYKGAKIDENR